MEIPSEHEAAVPINDLGHHRESRGCESLPSFLLKPNNFFKFTFGHAGSWLLGKRFLHLRGVGPLSSCGAQVVSFLVRDEL